jgi:cell division transport system permease protein
MRASFVISEVFTGLRRNVTMTIAMILTTMVSLTLFGFGLLTAQTVSLTKDEYLDDIEVFIYLTEDISANDERCNQQPCEGLKRKLEEHPDVEWVDFRNREQAYEKFEQLFADQPEVLDLGRPEALPASLNVKLLDPTRPDVITQDFAEEAGVDRIHDGGQIVEQLAGALNFFRNIAFVVSIVLLAAALFLIANMVQVSAYTRRTEVNIMRLVGATRWYTQLPFLLEAIVAGVIGALLAIVLIVGLLTLVPGAIADQLRGVINFPPLFTSMMFVSPILLFTAIVIAGVTGYVTLRMRVRT